GAGKVFREVREPLSVQSCWYGIRYTYCQVQPVNCTTGIAFRIGATDRIMQLATNRCRYLRQTQNIPNPRFPETANVIGNRPAARGARLAATGDRSRRCRRQPEADAR